MSAAHHATTGIAPINAMMFLNNLTYTDYANTTSGTNPGDH